MRSAELGSQVGFGAWVMASSHHPAKPPANRSKANCPERKPVVPSPCQKSPDACDHLISSAETVSDPARVMILFKTILLICWVTGRTLPSQNPKLTAPGCRLIQ